MPARTLALLMLTITAPFAALADADTTRVLQRLGVDRADVRACLAIEMATSPERRAEFERLAAVFDWIDQAVTAPRRSGIAVAAAQHKSDAFVDIVATFNHERRLDSTRLSTISDSRLTPHHISTYARVQRALGAGHDPKRVLCGL